jgi:hypothetical protein
MKDVAHISFEGGGLLKGPQLTIAYLLKLPAAAAILRDAQAHYASGGEWSAWTRRRCGEIRLPADA